ncbi:MAG: hypothetical protein D6719_03605 [Candidatus Dadabacteria bacterium]|nr:MAG: hypothetical protein D6719_03605 [Candidatus Dadabacteria bacterium]
MKAGDPALREFVKYLTAVHELYPGGVPLGALSVQEENICPTFVLHGTLPVKVLFVRTVADPAATPYEHTEGQLLKAIVEKGLKLSTAGVAVLQRTNAMSSVELLREIKESAVSHVIFLGADYLHILEEAGMNKSFGELLTCEQQRFMVTFSLNEILVDKKLKKLFWEHLQLIIPELKE